MNMVKYVREAKGILIKDVVMLAAGLISPHRLRKIEHGGEPKPHEKAALAHILDVSEKMLFPEKVVRRAPNFPDLEELQKVVRRPYTTPAPKGKVRK